MMRRQEITLVPSSILSNSRLQIPQDCDSFNGLLTEREIRGNRPRTTEVFLALPTDLFVKLARCRITTAEQLLQTKAEDLAYELGWYLENIEKAKEELAKQIKVFKESKVTKDIKQRVA